nr:reverse transcriptase domain-containing protein [Tanacetum cinerariifolium]
YIPGPEYPEYLPPADDMLPAEVQPLPAAVSPTAELPGYITEGDDDANDDGDDLSEDNADDEDEEESSDSKYEEEEHLAPTVLAPALYSFVFESDETEPFEEGETAATPPPFGYRVAARISVQPHILIPFRLESEVKRLLAIPTPPLSPVSLTSYTLPPLLMPLPIYTSLPTSSFPLPSSIPSTSGSESIPEADIPLRKRARFTTPTSRYEIGESYEVAYSRDYCARIMDYCQSREVYTSTLVTQIEALRREAMINEGVNAALAARDATRNGNDSHTSGTDFKGTEGVIELTRWFEKMESVFSISNCTASNQVKFATCTLQDDALTWWNSYVKTTTPEEAYAMTWATLKKKMTGKYCLG